MSLWDPEMFVRTVLVDWLKVVEVWVGANFLFGHDRSGTFTVLRTLGGRHGFRAEKIDAVRYKDFVVSSTRVRRLVAEGRVDEAGALLGHHYFIDGTVVHGDGRGREIGCPTANLETANPLLPPAGVYATTAAVADDINNGMNSANSPAKVAPIDERGASASAAITGCGSGRVTTRCIRRRSAGASRCAWTSPRS